MARQRNQDSGSEDTNRRRQIESLRRQVDTKLKLRPPRERRQLREAAKRLVQQQRKSTARSSSQQTALSQENSAPKAAQIQRLRVQINQELRKQRTHKRTRVIENVNSKSQSNQSTRSSQPDRTKMIRRLQSQVTRELKKLPIEEQVTVANKAVERMSNRQRQRQIQELQKQIATKQHAVNSQRRKNEISTLQSSVVVPSQRTISRPVSSANALSDEEYAARIAHLRSEAAQSQIDYEKAQRRVDIIETAGSFIPVAGQVIDYQKARTVCEKNNNIECYLAVGNTIVGIVPVSKILKLEKIKSLVKIGKKTPTPHQLVKVRSKIFTLRKVVDEGVGTQLVRTTHILGHKS